MVSKFWLMNGIYMKFSRFNLKQIQQNVENSDQFDEYNPILLQQFFNWHKYKRNCKTLKKIYKKDGKIITINLKNNL